MNYWKTKPVGGYDYAFIDIPQERLMCNICALPCCEAQISGCCGYVFCKVCLNKLRELTKAKYSCPHCHNSEFPTFPHKEADQQIKALDIYCPNKNKGCQWIGKLSDVDKHFKHGKCHDVECGKCKEIIPCTTFINHLVRTNTGFIVMCKVLLVVVAFFEYTSVNSTFLGRNSLLLILIHPFIDCWSQCTVCGIFCNGKILVNGLIFNN